MLVEWSPARRAVVACEFPGASWSLGTTMTAVDRMSASASA
jgi:hypothetical protein